MRKNFTLKTRGVLCCCTGVEIILPCVFLAILCIPKLLVPDSVNNDTVSRPYQLATPWGYDSCAHGYKLLVVPDTADARTLAERAVVNLACDAARSAFPDAPSAGRGKGFIDDILQCGRNANAEVRDGSPSSTAPSPASPSPARPTRRSPTSSQTPSPCLRCVQTRACAIRRVTPPRSAICSCRR